jgi:hypothetical protein
VLPFDQIAVIDGWVFDGSTTFTCATTGLYSITYVAKVASPSPNLCSMIVARNAVEILQSEATVEIGGSSQSSTVLILTQTCLAPFTSGDTLTLQAQVSTAFNVYLAVTTLIQDFPVGATAYTLTVTRVA